MAPQGTPAAANSARGAADALADGGYVNTGLPLGAGNLSELSTVSVTAEHTAHAADDRLCCCGCWLLHRSW